MNAAPQDQLRLLELQGLDTAAERLTHRRRTLPEQQRLDELETRRAALHDQLVAARTDDSDLAREQRKLEADVDQVRSRAERDNRRMDAGDIATARELEALRAELSSLARRQGDLEEQVLEVMVRREDLQGTIDRVGAELAELEVAWDEAARAASVALAGLDTETEQATRDRAALADGLPADLLALYEKVRADRGGVGAAALHRGRCEGCHLSLSGSDLARIRAAPPDAVLRCEECRRILVRTPESGV